MGTTSEQVLAHVRSMSDILSQNSSEMMQLSARVTKELESIRESLEMTSRQVTDTVSHAVSKTKDAGREIGNEVSSFSTAASQVAKDMQGVLNTVDACKDSLRTATDVANQRLKEASDAFNAQAGSIDKAAMHATETMAVVGDQLRQRAEAVNANADDAQVRLNGFRDSLQKLMLDFEDSTNRGAAQVSVAGDKMRQSLGEFAETSEKIAGGVRGTGEGFRLQLQNLGKSADEAVARVEVVLKTLRKHAESGITEQTGRAGQTFGRQVDTLIATAARAADTAKQLDEAHDRAHTGKFLEHTTYVIEQLHSLAVDIARIFQPSVEEELWKRYYKGDQGVFLRHITKTLSRQKFEAIQRKYQTDDKFRAYVMRYLKEYSALVKHARGTDRAEVLTTTFSTSDMGKLYMLLSKAMETGATDQASD
jgi:hypothetical protein